MKTELTKEDVMKELRKLREKSYYQMQEGDITVKDVMVEFGIEEHSARSLLKEAENSGILKKMKVIISSRSRIVIYKPISKE